MANTFDRRVIANETLAVLRQLCDFGDARLGGGAALSGVDLHHRLSNDVDIFFPDRLEHRATVARLSELAESVSASARIVRDAGHLVRAVVQTPVGSVVLDLVHDPVPRIEPEGRHVEGIRVESLADLRAAKLTCILSRSEPRDLVDLLFLDRAGYPPDADLGLALSKDAGVDPAVLAWLLGQFPTSPLPAMLVPLGSLELVEFRDALGERFRKQAVGD